MLTLYYVSATFLQSWRIQKVCNKIAEQLAQQTTIAFYTLQAGSDDGFDPTFASSELCGNRNAAKVTDILWLHGNQRGCCLRPLQTLHITPWISFPAAPSWLPFAYAAATPPVTPTGSEAPAPGFVGHRQSKVSLSVDESQHLNLLLEAEVEPQRGVDLPETALVRLEEYGKLIAWKIDSHLAVLIESDVKHFTKLLISTFLRNNLYINDQLPLLRIESVQLEGKPQPFELLANHLKRSTRNAANISVEAWQKHLEDLRALSVLAHQAREFESQKNRTEGKTGIIKPDLIAHEPRQTQPQVSSKAVAVVEPTAKVISTPMVTKTPPKKQANPTEIKKPLAAEARTSKLSESATSSTKATTSSSPTKPSELEKIAAGKAVHNKQTPVHVTVTAPPISSSSSQVATATESTPSKPSVTSSGTPTPTSSKIGTTTPSKTFVAVKPSSPPPPAPARPILRRNKDSLRDSKPLNVLVYSDSASARESTVATLRELLESDVYTIYPLTTQQVAQKYWLEQTALLVVCGAVVPSIGEILVDYFLHGGKLLSLCSDILHFILPNYRTAEVREHELVQFSYDKWQKVKMMHHIFCYQPSPVKKHFSTDSEESTHGHSRKPSMELKDLTGQPYKLDVQVLGTEETWNTPSLLLANSLQSGGKAVFSQVHLETNPSEFETDEIKFSILKQNERTRLEIFADLLRKYLDVQVRANEGQAPSTSSGVVYKHAYFLGRHESKFELLEKLRPRCSGNDNIIATPKLTMKFCGKDDAAPIANNNVLPILIHSCPDDFSTVEYFDHLKTEQIGRLVIYAPIISSSMHVISDLELMHGIAVLPMQQTAGMGRSNNQWLSPLGCAMFSIQLHISMDSPLGSRLPLIQHIVGVAIVNTLRSHQLYKVLDIALKWPNDVYAHGSNKIGGLVVNTKILGSEAIVNIGSGINLNNSKPTVCINDMITEHNSRTSGGKLPLLKHEQFIALIFNEIERLVAEVQNEDFDMFYELYYKLWLHSEQTVTICTQNQQEQAAKIIGIDNYGYLKVQLTNGTIETVQPDGNSFDMLKGLIVPKYN
ncbi:biotin--protein ligase isoform X2 [Scaptodrosophila lebanonensis]|uniref:Biotin--protein ligase isoform X2 n=1 Tax=Drosophila lebanonensis TaxID=7225 RepID=A0A6J2TNL4_DROLE|nr:biotin--protein ligase isoform X2 [Scaptodrosophila lebanonensis]